MLTMNLVASVMAELKLVVDISASSFNVSNDANSSIEKLVNVKFNPDVLGRNNLFQLLSKVHDDKIVVTSYVSLRK